MKISTLKGATSERGGCQDITTCQHVLTLISLFTVSVQMMAFAVLFHARIAFFCRLGETRAFVAKVVAEVVGVDTA